MRERGALGGHAWPERLRRLRISSHGDGGDDLRTDSDQGLSDCLFREDTANAKKPLQPIRPQANLKRRPQLRVHHGNQRIRLQKADLVYIRIHLDGAARQARNTVEKVSICLNRVVRLDMIAGWNLITGDRRDYPSLQ